MIRAYINRGGVGAPIVVEHWRDGVVVARTLCQEVEFVEQPKVRLVSVKGKAPGLRTAEGLSVHSWVEQDADAIAGVTGVSHAWDYLKEEVDGTSG